MPGTTPKGWISQEEFTRAVNALPLVSVDLLVLNGKGKLLLGRRKNRPAKDFWFTPGARIRKGEPTHEALARVWREELGQNSPVPGLCLIGAWDHFYADSAFSSDVSTHYVNLPHLYEIDGDGVSFIDALPSEQHEAWQWLSLEQAAIAEDVHKYVRVYAAELLIKRITHP